jgi:hypothetical protein
MPSIERLMILLTATGDQGVPLALGMPRAGGAADFFGSRTKHVESMRITRI